MKVPADMLLLRERQRKITSDPTVGPATTSKVYYRAYSRVMLFGTIVRGRVDHERLRAALTCDDESEPARHPAMHVTLYADDQAVLERAAPDVVRAAHLADTMRQAPAGVSDALRAYRAVALRKAWVQALGTGFADPATFAQKLEGDFDQAGAALIALLKNL